MFDKVKATQERKNFLSKYCLTWNTLGWKTNTHLICILHHKFNLKSTTDRVWKSEGEELLVNIIEEKRCWV